MFGKKYCKRSKEQLKKTKRTHIKCFRIVRKNFTHCNLYVIKHYFIVKLSLKHWNNTVAIIFHVFFSLFFFRSFVALSFILHRCHCSSCTWTASVGRRWTKNEKKNIFFSFLDWRIHFFPAKAKWQQENRCSETMNDMVVNKKGNWLLKSKNKTSN